MERILGGARDVAGRVMTAGPGYGASQGACWGFSRLWEHVWLPGFQRGCFSPRT